MTGPEGLPAGDGGKGSGSLGTAARGPSTLGLPRETTVTEAIHSARVIAQLEESFNKFLTRNCIWQETARTPVLIIHHF